MSAGLRGDRRRLASTALAGAIAMAVAMGFGRFSFTPILPGMMGDLHLTAGDAGLIASANFIGYLVGAVCAGQGWGEGREKTIGLGALLATSMLLAGMSLGSSVILFATLRFLAGLASAFAMIFLSQIVLTRGAEAGNAHVQSVHFAGVGLGIAVSSLLVFLVTTRPNAAWPAWREAWAGSALVALAGTALVGLLLPDGAARSGHEAGQREAPLLWSRAFSTVALTYGLFGFGYVVTATFLVAMARGQAAHAVAGGQMVEFLCWFVTGLSAVVSLFVWRPVMARFGIVRAYLCALALEAVGLLLTVTLPFPLAPILGGLLLGATFMVITAFGLHLARALSPGSERKALAIMTAAFGIGQIIGPLVAGWLTERSGTYTPATLAAAAVLMLAAGVLALSGRSIRAAARL
ncbi:MFS transporter [Xaviernesmea oryzae]|uniref:MFS transporter n=1 Tax=Xaviernesmea oryzae TaxID=464029 RepID=A0A1Q9AVJ3_9HYPH|nr:YbfB/YjiJ family MFS transporter [Xaviernesmea oryzae]OLP59443.1 MFS transporter [Xaviernesmea oryzae]SEL59768.1 Cyanate permease [Xaviernesmea oryzae]